MKEQIYISKVYLGEKLLATYSDALDVVVDQKIIFDGTKAYLDQECNKDTSQAFCPEQ